MRGRCGWLRCQRWVIEGHFFTQLKNSPFFLPNCRLSVSLSNMANKLFRRSAQEQPSLKYAFENTEMRVYIKLCLKSFQAHRVELSDEGISWKVWLSIYRISWQDKQAKNQPVWPSLYGKPELKVSGNIETNKDRRLSVVSKNGQVTYQRKQTLLNDVHNESENSSTLQRCSRQVVRCSAIQTHRKTHTYPPPRLKRQD